MGILEPILKKADPYTTGRPRQVDLREVLNAIFYLNKTAINGGICLKISPPYLSKLLLSQMGRQQCYGANQYSDPQQLRKEMGRNENPSAGIIDSQPLRGHRNRPGIRVRRG